MIRKTLLMLSGFVVGVLAGTLAIQYYERTLDVPNIMALRMVIFDKSVNADPQLTLRLLDVYDSEIHRQVNSIAHLRVDWREELFESQLKRYVALAQLGQAAAANQALVRAAELHEGTGDIASLRELALRMYPPASNEISPNVHEHGH